MKRTADDWPKALLNGVLVGAILFLAILPALGWAWHRVLPEHTHVFIGTHHSDTDEIALAARLPEEQNSCQNCSGTQIGAGFVHLPGNPGFQVLAIVALGVMAFIFALPDFSERVITATISHRSPALFPPDPPPNKRGCSNQFHSSLV